jgi:hypothetical protein
MGLSVKDRGDAVATFRYIHVEMMEMLAQWTPTTPEMEVKLMFGEHIWNVAQLADALGKRTHELRMPPQQSRKPVDAYVGLLAEIRKETDTVRRLSGFYDALLPGLAGRYRAYLDRTDSLMDAPTVRILEQVLETETRMVQQSQKLRAELPALGKADRGWLGALTSRDTQISSLTAPRAS